MIRSSAGKHNKNSAAAQFHNNNNKPLLTDRQCGQPINTQFQIITTQQVQTEPGQHALAAVSKCNVATMGQLLFAPWAYSTLHP